MTVVYDIFTSGQDGRNLGGVIITVAIDALVVWYVLTLARARRQGPLTSSNPRTAWIMNSVGSNPASVLSMTGLASLAVILPLLGTYWQDKRLFATGHYMTVTGQIQQDVVIKIAVRPRRSAVSELMSSGPRQHEWDQIMVAGKTFVVWCTRPTEASFAVVGIAGECLAQVEVGSRVQIDYLPRRTEPLRIELLNR